MSFEIKWGSSCLVSLFVPRSRTVPYYYHGLWSLVTNATLFIFQCSLKVSEHLHLPNWWERSYKGLIILTLPFLRPYSCFFHPYPITSLSPVPRTVAQTHQRSSEAKTTCWKPDRTSWALSCADLVIACGLIIIKIPGKWFGTRVEIGFLRRRREFFIFVFWMLFLVWDSRKLKYSLQSAFSAEWPGLYIIKNHSA